jgi:hypothetical protein
LFADVDHADDHGREDAGGLEWGGDGFAFLDAFVDGADGGADDDVAGGFLDDGEGLENGARRWRRECRGCG